MEQLFLFSCADGTVLSKLKKKQLHIEAMEQIEAKNISLSSKVMLERENRDLHQRVKQYQSIIVPHRLSPLFGKRKEKGMRDTANS